VSEIVWPTPFASFDRRVSRRHSLSGLPAADELPQTSRSEKALPPEPYLSTVSLLRRSLVDKELPALPRRPVGGYPSDTDILLKPSHTTTLTTTPKVTKDDIEVGRHKPHGWSLFPTVRPKELKRPVTSTGYNTPNRDTEETPGSAHTSNSSPVTALPVIPHSRPASRSSFREANLEPRSRSDGDQTMPEVPVENKNHRFGRLRKSFSVIGNMNKKPKRSHSSQPTGLRRKWSMLYMSAKSKPGTGRQSTSPEIGDVDHASRTWSPPAPNENKDPVGIYDPASKMWLVTQQSRSASFGIYDPESQQWLSPSPRIDSNRKEAKQDDYDLDANKVVPNVEVINEDEEQGALSLAEKLEILRYNPLTRTFSTPTTTIHNRPSTSNSDTGPPRAWKAGKILGITTPPTEDFASDLPMEEAMDSRYRMMHSVARSSSEGSGSGYMSFESHEEHQKKDWKGFWRNVQLGKRMTRMSNARRSAPAV
jgi:hypothetical protein